MIRRGLILMLAMILQTAPGRCETLVAALSSERVSINSNFTGAELAIFGEINRDAGTVARASGYDIVVTVRGPKGAVVVREKRRFGPFWLNLDQRKYIAIPAFIEVLSNRPVKDISTPALLARWHVGMDNLVPPQGDATQENFVREPEFRAALIRLRRDQGLFSEQPKAVRFFGPNLFRANIPLPGVVPLGAYEVDVALFVEGLQLATASTSFTVTKSGVEQRITSAARRRSILYGVITCALALLVGWLASVVFRRD